MKLLLIFSSLVLLFGQLLDACGTSGDRRLVIRTAASSIDPNSGRDGVVWARIWYGNTAASGQWTPWRALNNADCDDFEPGATDYFNDFYSYTSQRWWAVSLFVCGDVTDALLIESVGYWNGASQANIYTFCPNVAGSWANCGNGAYGTCGPDSGYTRMWLDADNYKGCNGITFRTDLSTRGEPFIIAHAGQPDCVGEFGDVSLPITPRNNDNNNNNNLIGNEFETKLLNYLMIVIGIAFILSISNSCLISVLVKRNVLFAYNKPNTYGKVINDDDDV